MDKQLNNMIINWQEELKQIQEFRKLVYLDPTIKDKHEAIAIELEYRIRKYRTLIQELMDRTYGKEL